jgi:fumarylacetoacetate (FAA) hydrolase
MELARALRGSSVPESYRREPLMSLRVAAPFLACRDDIPLLDGDIGLDLEAEVAVILDDVPTGTQREAAGDHVKLVTLVNDTSLRTVLAKELGDGRSAYLGKAPAAMAAVVATPDELGAAWVDAMLARPLEVHINGKLHGRPNAGVDASFTFADIVSHACRTRPLQAGMVVAAGTVSNRDASVGSACIAERRMIETRDGGSPQTGYLGEGDRVRIEMFGEDGQSIFGAIDQKVSRAAKT